MNPQYENLYMLFLYYDWHLERIGGVVSWCHGGQYQCSCEGKDGYYEWHVPYVIV